MRDTKDIAEAVFRIRDEYLEQKKKKNIRMKKICATVSTMAAAGIITAGAVHFASISRPERTPENNVIPEITVTQPAETTATAAVCDTFTTASVLTHTTAAVYTSDDRIVTAIPSQTQIKTSSSIISSRVTPTASYAATTAAAADARTTAAAVTTGISVSVTTDISEIDCEEVIRMKVENVKRYLAALSAAALASNGANLTANAQSLYTPRELDPLTDSVVYMIENPDKLDFDGNGKFDTLDAYALYTYVNEPESLPEGFAARCEANGDLYQDGAVNSLDCDLLKECCYQKFSLFNFDDLINYNAYLIPSDADPYTHVERSISPDAPADIRERLLTEFVDESYTYGSDENRNSFMDCLFKNFNQNYGLYDHAMDRYDDAMYKLFTADVERRGVSFDVNEDGKTDLKDLYDIYAYEQGETYVSSLEYKIELFERIKAVPEDERWLHDLVTENPDVNFRDLLEFPEDYKDYLWEKCRPLYDYADTFAGYDKNDMRVDDMTAFDLIARYIMSNTDIDLVNTKSLYYKEYRGDLTVFDKVLCEEFSGYMIGFALWKYFDRAPEVDPEKAQPGERYERIYDFQYRTNEELGEVLRQAKADFESGITGDLYDLNKDGKVDAFDSYTYNLFTSDLYWDRDAETSILPAEQFRYIDEEFDPDGDGNPGSLGDSMFLSSVAGHETDLPEYMLDIYYLELVEQKGLVDLSDIRPYIEQLCNDKQSGDVDFDGMVTAADATEVLDYYSKLSVNEEVSLVTEAKMDYMADCNSDGQVDCADATEILSTYVDNSVKN